MVTVPMCHLRPVTQIFHSARSIPPSPPVRASEDFCARRGGPLSGSPLAAAGFSCCIFQPGLHSSCVPKDASKLEGTWHLSLLATGARVQLVEAASLENSRVSSTDNALHFQTSLKSFSSFDSAACGILVPQPGMNLSPLSENTES